jgi:glutamyl-tRNA(Gln) amidotransferase subunit E
LWLVGEVQARNLCHDLLTVLVPLAYRDGEASFDALLKSAGYALHTEAEIIDRIPELEGVFHVNSSDTRKMRDWIMGRLRPLALGNVPLHRLAAKVEERL